MNAFDSEFRKLAIFAIIANILLFVGGVAVIAYAIKWVIS